MVDQKQIDQEKEDAYYLAKLKARNSADNKALLDKTDRVIAKLRRSIGKK